MDLRPRARRSAACAPILACLVAGAAAVALASVGCTVIDRTPPQDAVFSEGCGLAAPGAGPFSRVLEIGGVPRTYAVRYPGSYSPDFPFPLVFALHGAGGDGALIREYSDIERVSRAQAIYVYPDGAEFSPGLRAWDARPDSLDIDFLEQIRAELSAQQCVDTSRVFVFGFSSGATMAHAYACFTDSVRAFAAVAGGPPVAACTGPVAAWIAHDLEDTVVPIEAGERGRDVWRTVNACEDLNSATAYPAASGHCEQYACDAAPVVWCTGQGDTDPAHGWPAWASETLWGFFEAQ